jgi:hypothetical protein
MNELLLICIKGSDALSSVVIININYYNSIIIIIKINTVSVLVNLKMLMMFNSCIFLPKQLSSYISLPTLLQYYMKVADQDMHVLQMGPLPPCRWRIWFPDIEGNCKLY